MAWLNSYIHPYCSAGRKPSSGCGWGGGGAGIGRVSGVRFGRDLGAGFGRVTRLLEGGLPFSSCKAARFLIFFV